MRTQLYLCEACFTLLVPLLLHCLNQICPGCTYMFVFLDASHGESNEFTVTPHTILSEHSNTLTSLLTHHIIPLSNYPIPSSYITAPYINYVYNHDSLYVKSVVLPEIPEQTSSMQDSNVQQTNNWADIYFSTQLHHRIRTTNIRCFTLCWMKPPRFLFIFSRADTAVTGTFSRLAAAYHFRCGTNALYRLHHLLSIFPHLFNMLVACTLCLELGL